MLWLLHGAGDNGSGWLRHTAIERQATRRDLALVAPTAGMSMYEDMAHGLSLIHIYQPPFPVRLLCLPARVPEARHALLVAGGAADLRHVLHAGEGPAPFYHSRFAPVNAGRPS